MTWWWTAGALRRSSVLTDLGHRGTGRPGSFRLRAARLLVLHTRQPPGPRGRRAEQRRDHPAREYGDRDVRIIEVKHKEGSRTDHWILYADRAENRVLRASFSQEQTGQHPGRRS